MPLTGLRVTVLGVRETIAELHIAVSAMALRGTAGLVAGGKIIQELARENLAPHHYRGTAERQVSVSTPVVSPTEVVVTVGHHWPPFNPTGYTFEYGWHSQSGRRPPVQPIEDWLNTKGFAARGGRPMTSRQAAFIVARAIGQRGYSFGEDHWLDDAAAEGAGAVVGAVYAAVQW